MRPLHPLPRGRARPAARHLAGLLAMVVASAACDGFALSTAGPVYAGTTGTTGTGGVSALTLVGRWSHVAAASAAVGVATRSGYVDQTIWQFEANGAAVRTTRTLGPDGTVLESVNEPARWSADASTIRLAFAAPSYAVRYARYYIEVDAVRTTLYLDGVAFTRAGP